MRFLAARIGKSARLLGAFALGASLQIAALWSLLHPLGHLAGPASAALPIHICELHPVAQADPTAASVLRATCDLTEQALGGIPHRHQHPETPESDKCTQCLAIQQCVAAPPPPVDSALLPSPRSGTPARPAVLPLTVRKAPRAFAARAPPFIATAI